MKLKGFIITLDRSVERRGQVEKLLRSCPVPCETVRAVDGGALDDAERQRFVARQLYFPRYPFRLRPGEIGVFLSHRKAWQEIVTQGLRGGLILEDDIDFDLPVFRRGFDLAVSGLRPSDLIKFQVPGIRPTGANAVVSPQSHSPLLTPLGATSMIVGVRAARRLLHLTDRFDRPVDTFLQMSWVTGIVPRLITPSGVTEISHVLGGSTIQVRERPLLETLYRNIARPAYRLQVGTISYIQPLRQLLRRHPQASGRVRGRRHA